MAKNAWPVPTTDQPDEETLMEWYGDSGCEATDGCWVEPDGICPDGYPSWMFYLCFI